MQVITDQVLAFSKDNAPCATAQPGEVLLFKTQDCFAGRIPNEDVTMKDLNFSYGFTNPAAGPVYIEGAEPGDVLVVDIYDVQVADHGVIATDDHCGPLYQTTDYRSKIIPIEDGMADFNGVKFPIDPMIGVIGTAPDGEDVIDGFVGAHGVFLRHEKLLISLVLRIFDASAQVGRGLVGMALAAGAQFGVTQGRGPPVAGHLLGLPRAGTACGSRHRPHRRHRADHRSTFHSRDAASSAWASGKRGAPSRRTCP